MRVGEACNREVIIMDAEQSALEAAKLMRKHHVGSIVVSRRRGERREPLGILTDRDITVELVGDELNPADIAAGDAMSWELFTVTEDLDLHEALQRMRERGVRRVPVVDAGGALVGILAVDDVLELMAEELLEVVSLMKREQQRELKRR